MKKRKLFSRIRLWCICILLGAAGMLQAANNNKTLVTITNAYELNTATDLHVTAGSNAVTGSIDISNPDAVLIFDNIKPSVVIRDYASKITINGAAFNLNNNVLVSIYKQGSIVIPHGKSFNPLTVYTEENFKGKSNNTYFPNTYNRALGEFDNNIRSFKLKRGYMVTLATAKNGTGYSRVFVANHSDLEVPVLQTELTGKISFFRIFRWQWPNKKGYSGGDGTDNEILNTTWFYTWGAGENARVDREFVPQRHHETGKSAGGEQFWAWPGWNEINGRDETVTHVLGQNEPDNNGVTAKEVKMSPDEIVALWEPFLESGTRIGTPATTNPNNWIPEFVRKCKAKNLRVDYVAVHWYKGGQNPKNFINDLKWLHDQTGLPIWITEWNNGANWTTEKGFSIANGTWYNWTNNLDTDRNNHALWMKDVLQLLDEAPFIERYAIYNAVEAKRYVVDNHNLTAAGEVYANAKPTFAYDDANAYVMTWNHIAPSELSSSYAVTRKVTTLKWNNSNGEMTDSSHIERKFNDGEWMKIKTLKSQETTAVTAYDTLSTDAKAGNYTYRVRNFDCDGKSRYTTETTITLGGAEGHAGFQFGRLNLANTEEVITFFEPIGESGTRPAVFVGQTTWNNKKTGLVPQVVTILDNQFKFRYFPWTLGETTSMTTTDECDFLIVSPGNQKFGTLEMEVGEVNQRVGKDTLEVIFNQPFPTGITPVVLVQTITSMSTYPFMPKIWDVTSTGFKIKMMRQEGLAYTGFPTNIVKYLAITPGSASMGNGKIISAGISTNKIGGKIKQNTYLNQPEGQEPYQLYSPYLLGGFQTNNIDVPLLLRKSGNIVTTQENENGEEEVTTGFSVFRHLDNTATVSTNSSSVNGDYLGWIAISNDPTITDDITDIGSSTFSVSVNNRRVYVTSEQTAFLFTLSGMQVAFENPVSPGIYIVKCGNQSKKIIVK